MLVVEDDADLAALASDLLTVEGYSVVTARHGEAALRLLDAGLAPAVIVSDLMMPVLDGFGFLAEYRKRPRPRAPVLVVSAFEGYLDRAREAGATAILPKPYDLDELVEAVAALAERRAPPVERPPVRRDDAARLAEVAALALDRPAPTPALDAFAARAAGVFGVRIALVSIVTADRQYWHASCGLSGALAAARGSPRDVSFCTHAVAARAALVVQDALENPFFAGNTFVVDHGLRFYAGVPLLTRAGDALGTFCLLDGAPRGFGPSDLELLGTLSQRVLAELEVRERVRRPGAPASAFRHVDAWDAELDVLSRGLLEEVARLEALRAGARAWPLSIAVVATPAPELGRAVRDAAAALPAAHLGRLGVARVGVVAPRLDVGALQTALATACGPAASIAAAEVTRPDSGLALLAEVEARLGALGLAPRRDGALGG